ncbi:hypothetical protein Pla163_18920 [Planctomycetes bacterium Pla163]|uniref:Uncharacterized protein n=1 Tax=Rohdeia mirabilis TaxID=2528008 RepID=A0A518CZX8_9BACT|nr:hypothetical protein Pla163_18920 [Planctomycetes bacterium Pla163]
MIRRLRSWHRASVVLLAFATAAGLVWATGDRLDASAWTNDTAAAAEFLEDVVRDGAFGDDVEFTWQPVASQDAPSRRLRIAYHGSVRAQEESSSVSNWYEVDPASVADLGVTLLYRTFERPSLGGRPPADAELFGRASDDGRSIAYSTSTTHRPCWLVLYELEKAEIVATFELPATPAQPQWPF